MTLRRMFVANAVIAAGYGAALLPAQPAPRSGLRLPPAGQAEDRARRRPSLSRAPW